MNNAAIQLKIKQRLNKLDSSDYDNIEAWQLIEAFNKGQVTWCRRQLHGTNAKQEGDEQSKRRIDDLQRLLKEKDMPLTMNDTYFISQELPDDYFEWKRISVTAVDKCCDDPRKMVIYLAEEANLDELLRDDIKKPSFAWAESFCTLKNNKIRVFTNNEFEINDAILSYYRQPVRIQIAGIQDPYNQLVSAIDVECEFKDDIVEVLVDEAVKILAGDIESVNQRQIATNEVESNN